MKLNKREHDLIQTGLYLLESACIGDELEYELVEVLDGTPDSEEVRKLMNKLAVDSITAK